MIDSSELHRAIAGLEDLEGDLEDVAEVTVDRMGAAALEGVRGRLARHRRTGRTASYLELRRDGAGDRRVARVHAGGRVPTLLTAGTRPHAIRARAGHALELRSAGGQVRGFADSVRHPGTRPDPFVARGLEDARPELDRLAARAADDLATIVADDLGG